MQEQTFLANHYNWNYNTPNLKQNGKLNFQKQKERFRGSIKYEIVNKVTDKKWCKVERETDRQTDRQTEGETESDWGGGGE